MYWNYLTIDFYVNLPFNSLVTPLVGSKEICMSHIEIAVKGAKRLESVLEQSFGATGRGLHEKLNSVEKKIPNDVQKQIRYVASVRNRIVHETTTNSIHDPAAFEATVVKILKQLEQQSQSLEGRKLVKDGKSASKATSSGKFFFLICDRKVAPWFFLAGCVFGYSIGTVNDMGIPLSLLIGAFLGATAAFLSRLVYIGLGLVMVGIIFYALYDKMVA